MKYVLMAMMLMMGVQTSFAGTAAGAEAIVQEHQQAMQQWNTARLNATSADQLRRVMDLKPKTSKFRNRMIKEIGGSLKKSWSLKYSIWLLEATELGQKDTAFLLKYARQYHAKSPQLARFCFAVVYCSKPLREKKEFIEFALKQIKDPKQKGVASLALAVLLRGFGDSPVIMKRRQYLLRVAIINTKDEKIGETTAEAILKDEIYQINHLSKGKMAPSFVGVDSSMLPVSLTSYKGKVVMLVFWSSFDIDDKKTIELLQHLKKIEGAYAGKAFQIIGVNRDALVNLRELEKEGLVAGKTVSDPQLKIYQQYRVASPPNCYVIDQEGKIQYRGAVGSFATLTADALLAPKQAQPAQ